MDDTQIHLWPLVVYFLLVTAVLGATMGLSHFTGERHQGAARDEPYESGMVPVGSARLRLDAKFYLIAMFFIIFDMETVYLFAWTVALREAGWAGFVEAMFFILVLLATLAYLWRIGALDWAPKGRYPSRR